MTSIFQFFLLVFRSLFDSDSILVELIQPSNETLTVEVVVKLPSGVKGKANNKKKLSR